MTGFWVIDDDGSETHIKGNPNMADDTLAALMDMFSRAYREAAAWNTRADQAREG